MRDYETITEMAHKLPRWERSGLFFFILGYLGDDMPDGIRKEIERRYNDNATEKESM
jgi:hypothetical protein